MDKGEYHRLIQEIVTNGYGWDAIRDISKMMKTMCDNQEKVIRKAMWERKVARRMVASDKSNKAKVEALKDVYGEGE